MDSELDTPEFNHMLGILLDDLSSDQTGEPECVTYNGKTYLLTAAPKKSGFRDPSYNITLTGKKKEKNKAVKAQHLQPRLRRPRVVKTDVRASVPEMLTNVMNMVNFPRVAGLLQTFCMPEIAFRLKKPHPVSGEWIGIDIIGPMNIANVIFANITLFPDCTSSLLSSRFDPECGVIICELQMEMTKLFNVQSIHDILPNLKVESPGKSITGSMDSGDSVALSSSSSGSDSISGNQITEAIDNITRNLSLRKKPIHVIHRFKYVMVTNCHKRLTEIKVTQQVVQNDFSLEV